MEKICQRYTESEQEKVKLEREMFSNNKISEIKHKLRQSLQV